ncbi:MBL fold metallo-hydrolase [Candidatus Woesearchaeota archaeon]|nr:MBL fold metallo-hydrolase [Candidatus Woesearchaeota archaeon]
MAAGLEICTIGGFTKTEGNSVAVRVDNEVVILDMGLSMEDYIRYTEDLEDTSAKTYNQLLKANAVPDYGFINDWKDKVIAIIPTHGHLDHVGAVPFAAGLFPKAPIICTAFTAEVLKTILLDDKMEIPNKTVVLESNATYKLSEKIMVEFVHVTHSIPHTVIVVLHTPHGKLMYANDFKFDLQPVLEHKPNLKRLKELGDEGVEILIVDSLYAHLHKKTPSESVARHMLQEVMLKTESKGRAMIVTTFSSHIARLKSIIEMGDKLNRKIIFVGRSLDKYCRAAENLDLVDFSKRVQMMRFRDQAERMFKRIEKDGRDKYLIVCTGHQGEPKAVLSRIARKETEFVFHPGDIVVFSCQTIPVQINIDQRKKLEESLKAQKVRMFCDVHVSGHGALEDHREMFELVRPKHIIPIHAEPAKGKMLADFAATIGFKNTHIMQDGKRITL